jgi:hypothetical protein
MRLGLRLRGAAAGHDLRAGSDGPRGGLPSGPVSLIVWHHRDSDGMIEHRDWHRQVTHRSSQAPAIISQRGPRARGGLPGERGEGGLLSPTVSRLASSATGTVSLARCNDFHDLTNRGIAGGT